jgi:hypothetical protein
MMGTGRRMPSLGRRISEDLEGYGTVAKVMIKVDAECIFCAEFFTK